MIRDYIVGARKLALGHLGWTPAAFWGAAIHDIEAAQEGYLERIGAKSTVRPPSAKRMSELMEEYRAHHG